MRGRIAILIPLLLGILFAAGCTDIPVPPGTSGTGNGGTTAGASLAPGPTVTVPPGFELEIQVNRDDISVTPDITVFFRGGKGQIHLQRLDVKVTRSDGVVLEDFLKRPAGGSIRAGDSVTLRGTTGSDRVEVTAWINGQAYKIYDQLVQFKVRP